MKLSGKFHVVECNGGKEMYKIASCTCKIVVLDIKPNGFLTSSLPPLSSDLKVPI